MKSVKNRETDYIQGLNSIVDTTNSLLLMQEQERLDARENMAYYHGEYVVDSQSIPTVESVTPVDITGYECAYKVKIYEWTWIDYNDGQARQWELIPFGWKILLHPSQRRKVDIISSFSQ